MAKVLGPNNIAITAPSIAAPVRASKEAFGAPQADALGDMGKALTAVGGAVRRIKDEQQDAVDQAFLDRYDLESDLTYGNVSREEETGAGPGADGLTDRVRQRFEDESGGVLDRVRQQGFAPSERALQRAESIKLRRQHQYLRGSAVYESNERIRNVSVVLDDSLATVANRGVTGGDIEGALTRAEQSIESHRGILPPALLDQAREKAAKYFFEQIKANGDPDDLELITQRLLRGGQEAATPAAGAAAAAGRDGQPAPARPARNDAIGRAAQATGVDEATLRVFARIESGGKADARTGSYKGLFQLSDTEFARHGGGNIYNADDNALAAAKKLRAEASEFEAKHGRAPTALDLYLVHQQGEGGYDAHLARPGAPAWQNMAGTGEGRQKGARWAKQAIWGNIPDDMKRRFGSVENVTSADFIEVWRQKVARFGGGEGVVAAQAEPGVRGALAREMSTRLPEIQTLIDKRREQLDLQQRARAILGGTEPVDPGSATDQKLIDKAIGATDIPKRLGEADMEAAGQITALVKSTGYVPDSAISALRASAVNGTPEQRTFALETAANLLREKPGALEASEKSRALRDDAQLYETFTLDAGLPAQEALARIAELRTPEFAKRREALKKEVAETGSVSVMSGLSPSDITSDYDGWFTAEPALGGSPRQASLVYDTYRGLVKDHYIRTGDIEIAKSMAKKDLKRTYDVSEVTGQRRLMRHPPEKYYQPIEPRAGKEASYDYFSDQLAAAVKERAGKDVPAGDIFIEPVEQTNDDVRAGRLPGYGVIWFEEQDGQRVMQTAPGFVFRADVKSEKERESRNRQERYRQMRAAEETPPVIPRDPARALGDYFRTRELPTDTGAADRLRGGNREFFQGGQLNMEGGNPEMPQDQGGGIVTEGAADAAPQALRRDASGQLAAYDPRETPELDPPDMLDNAFLAGIRVYEKLGLADSAGRLYTDVIARGRKEPITEKDMTKEDLGMLRVLVAQKLKSDPGKKKGSVGNDDYLDAGFKSKGLLGKFNYEVDDDGNITVSDIYDFNLSDLGPKARNASVADRVKTMFSDPVAYAGYVGAKVAPDKPGKGVPVKIKLGKLD